MHALVYSNRLKFHDEFQLNVTEYLEDYIDQNYPLLNTFKKLFTYNTIHSEQF